MEIIDIANPAAILVAKNDTKSLYVMDAEPVKNSADEGFSSSLPKLEQKAKLSTCKKVYFQSASKMRLVPIKEESDAVFVAAPRGCGKSYYAGNYAKEYLAKYKKRKCYIFKPNGRHDPAFDGLPRTKFTSALDIPELIEEFGMDYFNIEQLEKSLVIIDDINAIQDDAAKRVVHKLRDAILENGRKLKISIVITSHQLANSHATKLMLTECNIIVFFPKRSGMDKKIVYYLTEHMGCEKKVVEFIMSLPEAYGARAVTFSMNPRFVLWDYGMALI